MSSKFWKHGRPWEGGTAAIFAGGPSLTSSQVEACRGLNCIAINNSYKLAPWADILYFCDFRWWTWHSHEEDYKAFPRHKVTLENLDTVVKADPAVKSLSCTGAEGLDLTEGCVRNGANGGYQALNLAVNLGARNIILLGYDMRMVENRTHWHEGHPTKASNAADQYKNLMRPFFENAGGAGEVCRRIGVNVFNCTPGSALLAFPRRGLEGVLESLRSNTTTTALSV